MGSDKRALKFDLYSRRDLRALREAFSQPPQARIQAEIVEDHRPQQLREFAHAAQCIVDHVDHFAARGIPRRHVETLHHALEAVSACPSSSCISWEKRRAIFS